MTDDPNELSDRTESACAQLTRYGGHVFDESTFAVLNALTDINDDQWHGRSPACIAKAVQRAREALDRISPPAAPENRPELRRPRAGESTPVSHYICQACEGSGVHNGCADDRPPIDMVLHCPVCGLQHIDKDNSEELRIKAAELGIDREGDRECERWIEDREWTNPPHRSHLCHGCGYIWRPADVPTNGVEAVKTKGKDDSPIVAMQAEGSRAVMEAAVVAHGALFVVGKEKRPDRPALEAIWIAVDKLLSQPAAMQQQAAALPHDTFLFGEVLYGIEHGWPQETLTRLAGIAERIKAQRAAAQVTEAATVACPACNGMGERTADTRDVPIICDVCNGSGERHRSATWPASYRAPTDS